MLLSRAFAQKKWINVERPSPWSGQNLWCILRLCPAYKKAVDTFVKKSKKGIALDLFNYLRNYPVNNPKNLLLFRGLEELQNRPKITPEILIPCYRELVSSPTFWSPHLREFIKQTHGVIDFPIPYENPNPNPAIIEAVWNLAPIISDLLTTNELKNIEFATPWLQKIHINFAFSDKKILEELKNLLLVRRKHMKPILQTAKPGQIKLLRKETRVYELIEQTKTTKNKLKFREAFELIHSPEKYVESAIAVRPRKRIEIAGDYSKETADKAKDIHKRIGAWINQFDLIVRGVVPKTTLKHGEKPL